jgi:serine/threonine-protein kinase
MIGKTLRNYRITDKIGVGGQGAVYKATDIKLGRTVVIKVLPEELVAKEANLRRFDREARLASSLDHPNICTIFDLDVVDGVHFIAMQHVEGKNVRQLVAGRPLELKTALLIALQVTDALATAHRRGIIHRDIKSGNVMVTRQTGQGVDSACQARRHRSGDRRYPSHRTHRGGVPYGTATYAALNAEETALTNGLTSFHSAS